MNIIHEAESLLQKVEEELRGLMEQGIHAQEYANVSEVAKLAEGLSDLLRKPDERWADRGPRGRVRTSEPAASRGSKSAKEYPEFVRDGDRLVKIGWSKKKRQEYEHRAPKTAVCAFAQALSKRTKVDGPFDMDQLLPIADIEANRPIPDYQAYITLAWMCTTGAIVKKGRDRYVLMQDLATDDALDALWERLPDHES